MRVIRWGFKLAWKGAPREMRRYRVGEVGSFDPRNAHAGVCWGWPKECSLTDTQAKTVMLKCYRSRNFTYPMLCAIRKSMSYAWELRGGVKSKFQKNFEGVNSVWNAVKESECPGVTMSQKPDLIPTPEELKKYFGKPWTSDHPWPLMKFLGGQVAAGDLFLFGLRSREDIDRVKKSTTHEFNWKRGWQCTSFVGGRAKLCGTKKGTRPWWVWRVCRCETKKHIRPPANFCEKIDIEGNPTTTGVPFDTRCPLAALELMWQLQPHQLGIKKRCYGKWLDSGRYNKHNVDDVAAFANDWLVSQGAPQPGFDSNAGRKSLARLTEHLNIAYAHSFHNHGDLWDVFQKHYSQGLGRSDYAFRAQSRDPKVASLCMRLIAQFLTGSKRKVRIKLCKQSRFAYNLLKALGHAEKAERIKCGIPSDDESSSDESD